MDGASLRRTLTWVLRIEACGDRLGPVVLCHTSAMRHPPFIDVCFRNVRAHQWFTVMNEKALLRSTHNCLLLALAKGQVPLPAAQAIREQHALRTANCVKLPALAPAPAPAPAPAHAPAPAPAPAAPAAAAAAAGGKSTLSGPYDEHIAPVLEHLAALRAKLAASVKASAAGARRYANTLDAQVAGKANKEIEL